MNIHQSMSLSTLAPEKPSPKAALLTRRMKASAVVDGIFNRTPSLHAKQSVDTYRKKWITSRVFIRASVPTNKLATLKAPDRNEVSRLMAGSFDVPVIADLNKPQEGIGNFIPKVIVLEGAAAVEAAHRKGLGYITVWLGAAAAEELDIMADDQLSSDELYGLINDALRARAKKSRSRPAKTSRLESVMPYDNYSLSSGPWVEQVYPFENYCIFRDGQQTFRQGYTIVDRTVELSGEPTEVERKYEDKAIAASAMDKTLSMYACGGVQGCSCGCGGAKKLKATVDLDAEDDDCSEEEE